jgi:GntR family transcriptional regulator
VQQEKTNHNALPKYVQISELLIREISAGRLLVGERLPPEREMASDLNTSVGTLRKSLKELELKGLLERVQGSGNYIRHGDIDESVYAMFRLELLSGGGLPRADILNVRNLEKPINLPEFGRSNTGTRVRRLRYLNDTIIAIEEIWLDASAGTITESLLSDSLYHYYRKHLGFWITRAEDRIVIDQVPSWAPNQFTLPVGQTTAFIERFGWSDNIYPIEYSRTWYDTNHAHYVQRMK